MSRRHSCPSTTGETGDGLIYRTCGCTRPSGNWRRKGSGKGPGRCVGNCNDSHPETPTIPNTGGCTTSAMRTIGCWATPARFLGYDIVVHNNDAKHDRNGHRSINGQIGLKMPMDVVRAKRRPYMRRGKPAAILARAHDSDFRIVARYQAEFRGIAEYYQLAYNRHRLGLLRWVMERSLTKTLGHKNKISVNKVWNRYRATWQTPAGPRRGLQVTVERGGGKRPLVARWGGVSLARRTTMVVLKDDLPAIWRKRPAELINRLMSGRCELCQARTDVETHHVRRLKDLLTGNRAEQPDWAKLMASRRRRTLIVCVAATTESTTDFRRSRF